MKAIRELPDAELMQRVVAARQAALKGLRSGIWTQPFAEWWALSAEMKRRGLEQAPASNAILSRLRRWVGN
jgi:hypothetical protein